MNNPCNVIPIGSKETNIFTFVNHIMMCNFRSYWVGFVTSKCKILHAISISIVSRKNKQLLATQKWHSCCLGLDLAPNLGPNDIFEIIWIGVLVLAIWELIMKIPYSD